MTTLALKGIVVEKGSIDTLLCDLGAGIRELRLSLNLSQQVVAERSAVSLKAIKNLENGTGASLRSFIAVCRTLGKLDWMNTIPPPDGESPLEMWKRLNKPKRQRAGTARGGSDDVP